MTLGTAPIDPGFLTLVGPAGVFILAVIFLYLRYGSRPVTERFHEENRKRLEEIQEGTAAILDQVTKMNGRLAKIEEWRAAHEKQDDERYGRNQDEHDRMFKDVDRTRDGLHSLRNEISQDYLAHIVRQRAGGKDV